MVSPYRALAASQVCGWPESNYRAELKKAEAAKQSAELEAKLGLFGDLMKACVRSLRAAKKVRAGEAEFPLDRNVRKAFPPTANGQRIGNITALFDG